MKLALDKYQWWIGKYHLIINILDQMFLYKIFDQEFTRGLGSVAPHKLLFFKTKGGVTWLMRYQNSCRFYRKII